MVSFGRLTEMSDIMSGVNLMFSCIKYMVTCKNLKVSISRYNRDDAE